MAESPASYIFMYCSASSTAFTAVHCFQFKKMVLELNTTFDQSLDRTVNNLCLWLQNERGQQFCEEFAPRQVGTNNNETHACEPIFCNFSLVFDFTPSCLMCPRYCRSVDARKLTQNTLRLCNTWLTPCASEYERRSDASCWTQLPWNVTGQGTSIWCYNSQTRAFVIGSLHCQSL